MAQVGDHSNLVSLIGVCTKGEPILMLVAFCEHGNLLDFLKKDQRAAAAATTASGAGVGGSGRGGGGGGRTTPQLTVDNKVQMLLEIARGMTFLTEASFVHRDLAARNVLLDSAMECRVADFGLSRGAAAAAAAAGTGESGEQKHEVYYRSQVGIFALRWTAPEAMDTLKFSSATDVWSFGVVGIELFNGGEEPYIDLADNVLQAKLRRGYRHAKPLACPDELYNTFLDCWNVDAARRPSFAELVELLQSKIVHHDRHLAVDGHWTALPSTLASQPGYSQYAGPAPTGNSAGRVASQPGYSQYAGPAPTTGGGSSNGAGDGNVGGTGGATAPDLEYGHIPTNAAVNSCFNTNLSSAQAGKDGYVGGGLDAASTSPRARINTSSFVEDSSGMMANPLLQARAAAAASVGGGGSGSARYASYAGPESSVIDASDETRL